MAWDKVNRTVSPVDTIDGLSISHNALVANVTSIMKKDNVSAKTAAYTLVKDSTFMLTTDADDDDFTLTLPAATTCSGQVFIVKHIGSIGVLTIDATSSHTIDGQRYLYLVSKYCCVWILSDGTNWHIINAFGGNVDNA